jgi:uncharacterized lipoprotein YajG
LVKTNPVPASHLLEAHLRVDKRPPRQQSVEIQHLPVQVEIRIGKKNWHIAMQVSVAAGEVPGKSVESYRANRRIAAKTIESD